MNIRIPPQELALDIAIRRSLMKYQMGAAIFDNHGIYAWGWNFVNGNKSVHAEIHAIERANRRRLAGSIIVIAGIQNKNGKRVLSRPCPDCMTRILRVGIAKVIYYDPSNPANWTALRSAFV